MKKSIVIGFYGWCDAGGTIHHMMNYIVSKHIAKKVDKWDIEPYWHTDNERPQVVIKYGLIRKFSWPSIQFFELQNENSSIGVAFGPEPTHNWKDFSQELISKIKQMGYERLILVGSLYDQIFHDEVVVSGLVGKPDDINLVRSAGCRLVEYEGPSAIHSQIVIEAHKNNLEALSLWIHVPFYLKGPHEGAIVHLLEVINYITGAEFLTSELNRRWNNRLKSLEKLLQNDEELKGILETLRQKDNGLSRALPSPTTMTSSKPSQKVIRMDEFIKRKQNNENRNDE